MSTLKPVSVPPKRLSATISSSASGFKLNNILDWDGETALTSARFGSLAYGAFTNAERTRLEIFAFDPTTIASTTINFVYRGLSYDGDYDTEVSANKQTWLKNQTIVLLGTDVPAMLAHYIDDVNPQTIGGLKTFSGAGVNPTQDVYTAPTNSKEFAPKGYVDSVVAGIVNADRLIVAGNAGETVATRRLVYFDTTDNEWKISDAGTAATVQNVQLGITQGAGTNGNPIAGGVLVSGLCDGMTGLVGGDVLYAGTAGALSTTPGATEVTIGVVKPGSTTEFYFNPRFDQQLTEDQQDALAGSSGTPSATNKFMTQADPAVASFYGATVVGTDAYAVTPTVPQTLTNGLTIRIKLDVSNTGPATFNYNGGGALAIVKGVSTALVTGDLPANKIITLVYNSTGTVWQLVDTPNSLIDGSTLTDQHFHKKTFGLLSNGAGPLTQAHGLGVTPKRIKITVYGGSGSVPSMSVGEYDGTNYACIAASNFGTVALASSTSYVASCGDAGSVQRTATVTTFDATNFGLTWSGGTPIGTIFWEAEV